MIKQLKILTLDDPEFPDPNSALDQPNGLLAMGGDLNTKTLLKAYRQGIFPWYGDTDPILWWSPDPRAVIFPKHFHASHSLRRMLHKAEFTITFNKAFANVIQACAEPRADRNGTWITKEMIHAYLQLHELGYAHSVEVWLQKQLIGGIYGVDLGHIFCGESMFSRKANASKIAIAALMKKLEEHHYILLDCQIMNPHLKSLGAQEIPRKEYLALIRPNI